MDPTARNLILCSSAGEPAIEYIGTYQFKYARNYQTDNFTVPTGVVYIRAFVVGSAGQPDGYPNGFSGGSGGGGGGAIATIPVTAGENLRVGVGMVGNNGSVGNALFGSSYGGGGGFSSIFRGSTPLIISGGGGGGAVNSTAAGGAAGGTAGGGGNYLAGSGSGAGGGYYGGTGTSWGSAGSGGSGYVGASGNIHTSRYNASGRYPSGTITSNRDYTSVAQGGTGQNHGVGGSGNNSGSNSYGSGLVVIHTLGPGYSPSSAPVIPYTRVVLQTS